VVSGEILLTADQLPDKRSLKRQCVFVNAVGMSSYRAIIGSPCGQN
jgi:hypothetical protein